MRAAVAIAVFAGLAAVCPASADHRPVIHPDGTVVHGDWGLHRPGHIVPFVDDYYGYIYVPRYRGWGYYPTNRNDPSAYRSRATRAPSVPGPRYRRTWSTHPHAPADIDEIPYRGPYVIPAPDVK
jgi:hypothetical protein